MNILRLTLNKEAFETMIIGLKNREYRVNKSTNWIKNRLVDRKTGMDKDYDFVMFINGYSASSRYFVVKYKGYEIAKKNYSVEYRTGLKVKVKKGNYRILLGSIVRRGNINSIDIFNI